MITAIEFERIVATLRQFDCAYVAASDRISALHPGTVHLEEVRAMEAARDELLVTVPEIGERVCTQTAAP